MPDLATSRFARVMLLPEDYDRDSMSQQTLDIMVALRIANGGATYAYIAYVMNKMGLRIWKWRRHLLPAVGGWSRIPARHRLTWRQVPIEWTAARVSRVLNKYNVRPAFDA